jgi:Flp pilus assembly protein TadD
MNAQVGPDSLNVADAAIAGGNPDMALSVSQSVLQADPNNVDALEHEGDAYYALGRCPASEAAYRLALVQAPKATAAETGLGRCLLKTDPPSAEAAFEAATQDDPGNADAWNDLGIARDLQGNFAGAVDPYQKALVAEPSLTAAEVNLGLSLALSGNGAQALQYLGPLATGQNATPKIREDYAAALVASGRDSEARQVLAVDLPPDQVDAAMSGFSSVIAQAQEAPLPPPAAMPTMTSAPAAPVSVAPLSAPAAPTPLTTAVVEPAPAPAPAPVPLAPAAAPSSSAGDNSDAAYTGPSPVPVTASSSTPGPSAPAAPPAAVSADTVPAGTGSFMVQLASLPSSDDAQRAWTRISNSSPALFGDKSPDIEAAKVHGKTYYRLRVGGFNGKADAATFCGEVLASGQACTVANF